MVCTVMGMKSVGEMGAGEGTVNFACHSLTAWQHWGGLGAVSLGPTRPAREIQGGCGEALNKGRDYRP